VSPGYHILGEQVRGGAAEYLAVPVSNLLLMPENWGFPEAAARCWSALQHGACSSIGPAKGRRIRPHRGRRGWRQFHGHPDCEAHRSKGLCDLAGNEEKAIGLLNWELM